jgi:hypothetical protein
MRFLSMNGGTPRRHPKSAKRETASPKVNERAAGINSQCRLEVRQSLAKGGIVPRYWLAPIVFAWVAVLAG